MSRASPADSILSRPMVAQILRRTKKKGIAALSNMKACHQAK